MHVESNSLAATWSVSRIDGTAPGVCEVVGAFAGLDGFDEVADAAAGVLDRSPPGDAHPVFDLGEGPRDWIEVGEWGGKNQSLGPAVLMVPGTAVDL